MLEILSPNLLAELHNYSPGMVVFCDFKTKRILHCNQTFIEHTGYKKEEIDSFNKIHQLFHPHNSTIIKHAFRSLKKHTVIKNIELLLQTKVNTMHVATSVSLLQDEMTGLKYIVLVMQDISEFKSVLKELSIQKEALKKKNHDFKNLIYILSHDLKSPLRIINYLSSLVSDEITNSSNHKINGHNVKIKEQSAKANTLIENAIKYFMHKDENYYLEEIDIKELVKEIDASLTFINKGALTVKSTIKHLFSFKLALRQILYNLVNNAFIHHTNQQKAKVNITIKSLNKYYIITVQDNGTGIPPQLFSNLFKPFKGKKYSLDMSNSGLGLAIVGELVQKLEGKVSVKSEAKKGTTFTITLPISNSSLINQAKSKKK
jgi:PAS domain S-box-containing protein